jgi:hypothetical protein
MTVGGDRSPKFIPTVREKGQACKKQDLTPIVDLQPTRG